MTIPYPKNGKIRGGAGVLIQKSRPLFGCVKFERQSRYPCDDALCEPGGQWRIKRGREIESWGSLTFR